MGNSTLSCDIMSDYLQNYIVSPIWFCILGFKILIYRLDHDWIAVTRNV